MYNTRELFDSYATYKCLHIFEVEGLIIISALYVPDLPDYL